jgi:NADPH-dependent 2,4-dienoyl-CoA reductase/sulfur reductase-like enzyme
MIEVVIIGGGPAGIAAACKAAQAGARVCLLVEDQRLGGQIWRHGPSEVVPKNLRKWQQQLEHANIEIYLGVTVIDIADGAILFNNSQGGSENMTYDKLILACGSREVFLPFPGWTLPNVIGAGAAQALLKEGWSFEGKRVLVAGTGPLLFAVAGNLAKVGAKIVAIVEQAPMKSVLRFAMGTLKYQPLKLLDAVKYGRHYFPAPYIKGSWIRKVNDNSEGKGAVLSNDKVIACDVVACGFGLFPNGELAELAGCRMEKGYTVVDQYQQSSVEGIFCAGEITGIGGMEQALIEGEIAGLAAVGEKAAAGELLARQRKLQKFADNMNHCFELREELRNLAYDNTIVCRCEDVTYGQLKNQQDQRTAKMMTRAGMGSCQGRVCSCASQFLFGWDTNKVQMPVVPVAIGDLCPSGTIENNCNSSEIV